MRRDPFRRAARRNEGEDRILPLINIVFLLLIVFMVVGKLSAADPFEIEPPRSASEGPPPDAPRLVSIGPAGQLALDGEILDEALLVARVSASGVAEIRVKADARVEARRVVAVLDRLREGGVWSVRLLTVAGDGG